MYKPIANWHARKDRVMRKIRLRNRWRLIQFAVIGLLIGLIIVSGALVSEDLGVVPEIVSEDEQDVRITQELSLAPDKEGAVQVEESITLPASITSFELRIPRDAEVIDADGFNQTDDRTFAWNGDIETVTISYYAHVNRQIEGEGPIAGPGQYYFYDGGDWALFQRPSSSYSLSWRGDHQVATNRTTTTAGEGVVNENLVYLGEYERHDYAGTDHDFVLIEPTIASLAESPDDIFSSLEHASTYLDVGSYDEPIFMIAAPTTDIRWGVRGLQIGAADMWVRDSERLDDPNNVWIHEYVHTQQRFATDASARWLFEATATYYAALITYEQERIETREFDAWIALGDNERYDDVVMNDPETWDYHADYLLGQYLLATIDEEIASATNGTASFVSVFRALNDAADRITHERLIEIIEQLSDADIAAWVDRLLATTERPTPNSVDSPVSAPNAELGSASGWRVVALP